MTDKLSNDEFDSLIDRMKDGDPSKKDVTLFRKQLPHFPEFFRGTGDLVRQAKINLLSSIEGAPGVREIFDAGWLEFRKQLGYGSSPPLEEALIQNAALCWLRLCIVEQQYTMMLAGKGVSLPKGRYWEDRLNATQRRFLRAMETLARVRKLKLPPMQVNIAAPGSQQANVMGEVKVGKN